MLRIFIVLCALASIGGCAARQAFNEGRALLEAGNVEAGLAKIEEAAKLDPQNREYRQQYFLQRDTALQRTLALAEAARLQGQWDEAEALYRRMFGLDAQNPRAVGGLEALRADRRQRALLAEADAHFKKGETQEAYAKTRQVIAENANQREAQLLRRRIEERELRAAGSGSQLSSALKRPITLEFRDTALRTVLELISKNTGLNFLFDREVRPDLRATIFVRNTSIEDAIRFLLVTNQLERKVLNENTLLIYPNTPAKARDYQDLVVRSFYLANTDVKLMANTIRTLVKTKDLQIDEKLNLLIIRDTPEAVRMAERLVANQDLAEPEVMLEVEVLEVGSNVLSDLGIRWPDQFSYSVVGAAGTAGALTLSEWNNRNANLVRLSVTNPFLVLNLKNQEGRTNLLANPRIRVKNKNVAKVHIGDKVPVITTTSTATGFVAESVNYLDVGLKLEVEPTIFLDDEVGIRVGLEVSSIVREIRSTAGTLTYQVGTRNASTALRLKDGETQILAGLISDEDRRSANTVPGLGELPVLGRLFGSHNTTATKTEIVLLITPRIVRSLARPELRFEEFPSGTEAAVGAAPLLLQSVPLAGHAASAVVSPSLPFPEAKTAAAVNVALLGPASLAPGQEFTVHVSINAASALRNAGVDLVFDPSRLRFVRAEPGALLATAGKDVVLRANAPEGLGRLNLSLASPSDITGSGELARVTLRLVGPPVGTPLIRIDTLSLTDSAGKVLAVQLPPPLALSPTR